MSALVEINCPTTMDTIFHSLYFSNSSGDYVGFPAYYGSKQIIIYDDT
jgi:hypothetical protein